VSRRKGLNEQLCRRQLFRRPPSFLLYHTFRVLAAARIRRYFADPLINTHWHRSRLLTRLTRAEGRQESKEVRGPDPVLR
jgi:hypothetical protein